MYSSACAHTHGGPTSRGDLRDFIRFMSEREDFRPRGRRGRGGWERGWEGPRGGFPFDPSGRSPFGRPRKARRGDIRMAALLLIAEEPRNGYQIMQELKERTQGQWRPSPGSVYPALSQLLDEGLISSDSDGEGAGGGQPYVITESGQAEIEARPEGAKAPWELFDEDPADDHRALIRGIAMAYVQVVKTGTSAQAARARELLLGLRRDLYRILAEEDSSEETSQEAEREERG